MSAVSLLHVGYMKTATTYLQAHVFDNFDIGFAIPMDGGGRAFLVQNIILSDGFTFDGAAIAERFQEVSQPLIEQGLIPVWSDESLLGEPVTRRYDAHTNALRLHKALPEARVVITIREQRALAYAMYIEYMRQGGLASIDHFLGTGDEAMSFSPILRQDYLYFDRAVEFYQNLFGVERVLILPHELLLVDRNSYFERLSAFTGRKIDVAKISTEKTHKTIGSTANHLRYFVNRLKSPHPLTNRPGSWERGLDLALRAFDRLMPSQVDNVFKSALKRKIDQRYDAQFTQSNRKLSKLIGLDLSKFGYE